MRLPSVKTLQQITPTPEAAAELRAYLEKKRKTTEHPAVREWIEQCHHMPAWHERVMCVANHLMDGYGVEAIFAPGEMQPDYSYINMGGVYDATLIFNHGTGGFRVADIGTIIEKGKYE